MLKIKRRHPIYFSTLSNTLYSKFGTVKSNVMESIAENNYIENWLVPMTTGVLRNGGMHSIVTRHRVMFFDKFGSDKSNDMEALEELNLKRNKNGMTKPLHQSRSFLWIYASLAKTFLKTLGTPLYTLWFFRSKFSTRTDR